MTMIDFSEILTREQIEQDHHSHTDQPSFLNQASLEVSVHNILRDIGEDPNREGLIKTPNRVARMYNELTSGYHTDPVKLINGAVFSVDYDEMVVVKDIDFHSLCEHHMLPFFGRAHVAYIPDGKVVGQLMQGQTVAQIEPVEGIHTIYLVFENDQINSMDWFQFR